MKKLKLIPGLILLALCVAVLGVGIYAAAPASNTITGTVSVTAANAEVSIALYDDPTDYVSSQSFGTGTTKKGNTRTGLSLSYSAVEFDASSANSVNDVTPVTKLIVVKNNSSSKHLGVYFQDKAGSYTIHSSYDAPTQATMSINGSNAVTASDILYGNVTTHYNASTLNGKVRLDCTFYSHIAPGRTVEMFVQFSLLDLDYSTAEPVALNLYLNVEEYQPSAANTYAGFVKWAPPPTGSASRVTGSEASPDDNLVGPSGEIAPNPYLAYQGALVAIVIPQGVTQLGADRWGFMNGCSNLVAASIPNTVTSFGQCVNASAFEGCNRMASVTIPWSVDSMVNEPFRDCGELSCIIVDPNNTKFDSRNNCNAIIASVTYDGYNAHELIRGSKRTIIPNTVTSIGSYSFSGCSGLTSIIIPSDVTWMGENVFKECSNLTTIVHNGTLTNAYTLPTGVGYHWKFNGNTVTTISAGAAARGTYSFVAD